MRPFVTPPDPTPTATADRHHLLDVVGRIARRVAVAPHDQADRPANGYPPEASTWST